MLNWEGLSSRIRDGETDQTELKRTSDTTRIGPAACAMANSMGGVIVLGVDDDGTVVGIPNPGTVHEQLTSFLQDGLSAPLNAQIGRATDPTGKVVMWVEVSRQRGYEPLRYKGIVYVRRARSSVEPSSSELQDLYNLFGYVVTEERAIQAATVKDIDTMVFERFMANMGISLEEEPKVALEIDLRNRGILTDIGGELRATVYGVMGFGARPQSYPQTGRFRIDASVYQGTDRGEAETVTVSTLDGRLDQQVERAVDWLKRLGRVETFPSGGDAIHRTERYRLPLDAFREAVVNAVAHRDYGILGSQILIDAFDDRIEITSPGSLPNHMDVASAMAGGNPRARNQAMANFCLVMKLMETRGRGFPRMRSAMKKFNGTVPQLSNDRDARFVRVTFDTRLPGAPGGEPGP